MKIEEGNKIIAEFMGYTRRDDISTDGSLFMQAPIDEGCTHSSCYIVNKVLDVHDEFLTLEYHSSWDWLMQVVEKIEMEDSCSYKFIQHFGICFINDTRVLGDPILIRATGANRLETTYNCCLKFINWYNTQNKQPWRQKQGY